MPIVIDHQFYQFNIPGFISPVNPMKMRSTTLITERDVLMIIFLHGRSYDFSKGGGGGGGGSPWEKRRVLTRLVICRHPRQLIIAGCFLK